MLNIIDVKQIQLLFPELSDKQVQELKKYEEDKDLNSVLNELESNMEALYYLRNLVNIPTEQINKDILKKEILIKELKKEIRLFLKEISSDE